MINMNQLSPRTCDRWKLYAEVTTRHGFTPTPHDFYVHMREMQDHDREMLAELRRLMASEDPPSTLTRGETLVLFLGLGGALLGSLPLMVACGALFIYAMVQRRRWSRRDDRH